MTRVKIVLKGQDLLLIPLLDLLNYWLLFSIIKENSIIMLKFLYFCFKCEADSTQTKRIL